MKTGITLTPSWTILRHKGRLTSHDYILDHVFPTNLTIGRKNVIKKNHPGKTSTKIQEKQFVFTTTTKY